MIRHLRGHGLCDVPAVLGGQHAKHRAGVLREGKRLLLWDVIGDGVAARQQQHQLIRSSSISSSDLVGVYYCRDVSRPQRPLLALSLRLVLNPIGGGTRRVGTSPVQR